MSIDQLAVTSHTAACLLFAILAAFFLRPWRDGIYSPLFIVASTATVAWYLVTTSSGDIGHPTAISQLFAAAHYSLWIIALLATLLLNIKDSNAKKTILPFYAVLFILSTCGIAVAPYVLHYHDWAHIDRLILWTNLLLSVLGLIVVEQVFRNTLVRQKQAVTFLCFGSSLLFAFDIFVYSNELLFDDVDKKISETRAMVMLTAAICLIFATTRTSQSSTVSISRRMVVYSASLICSGVFLFAMAATGYYVKLYGGNWGSVLQAILSASALLVLIVTFASPKLRGSLRVFVNKHFFMHKYDYRMEWLNLINVLSQPLDKKDSKAIALEAASAVFHSPETSLWLRADNEYRFAASTTTVTYGENKVLLDSDFCEILSSDWVFHPQGKSRANHLHNACLPEWIMSIPSVWIVLPIISQQKLLGFMVLTKPKHTSSLTWEDLDVVKTVGRQLGSYLALHVAAEQLAQSKQFDTYNKLTAFIMHDLKNLIAQQALVVENAKKHKENPAFVEDAIKTIENSVVRMSNLLSKMQQRGPSVKRSLELNKILVESINKCRDKKPVPSLRMTNNTMWVAGDHDHLVMIFAHVIKNAQEATAVNGFVDVYIEQHSKTAKIIVEDNGQGMAAEFIRDRLFKPFDTTKSGQGMGIGVFQTREYIRSLGGDVNVESVQGKGSTFTITMPTVEEHTQNGRK